MSETLLFFDFETYGTDLATARPVQFAAIRTDLDLNPVGEPINLLCKPAPDFLPSPVSTSIHGITPQFALEHGICESEFAGRVFEEMSRPGTCSVGYNSMSFDSKIARFLFWRNFLPAYKAEYDQGCSKWDVKTLAEAAFALRPDGIIWPVRDGNHSLKLEHLAEANGLVHEAAHDALSDVLATVALAKLIKETQPRLFTYSFENRLTSCAEQLVHDNLGKIVFHVSSFYGYARRAVAPVLLVCKGKGQSQSRDVFGIDLSGDVKQLSQHTASELRERLYTRTEDLATGESRPPLVRFRTNEGPFLTSFHPTLSAALGTGVSTVQQVLENLPPVDQLADMLTEVFGPSGFPPPASVDEALYDGFIPRQDEATMDDVRNSEPEDLWRFRNEFGDPRLTELLLLFRGRNYPGSFNASDRSVFKEHCRKNVEAQLPAFDIELGLIADTSRSGLADQLAEYSRDLLAS